MSPAVSKSAKEEDQEATITPTKVPTSLSAMPSIDQTTYLSKKSLEIPLLKDDGSNYAAWKFRQTTVLRLRGLFSLANGTETMPGPLTGDDAKDEAKIAEQSALVTRWQKRDEEAFAQIALSMEDGAMAEVIEATTAQEAWTRIIERWEGKGMQSLSFLYQQLTSTKIEEEADLTNGFTSIRTIAAKMKTLGEPLSDLLLAQIMMTALPPSYAIVNTVIQTSNQNGTITSDMVAKAALAEEERRKQGVGLTAMFSHASKSKNAHTRTPNDSKGKAKDRGPPCDNCAKPGHTKDECWAKGGGAEGTGPHQKRRAERQSRREATESGSEDESAKLAMATGSCVPAIYALHAIDSHTADAPWLLDSGASRHMSPNRQWFTSYQPLTAPLYVSVGDGNKIPAIGVGNIPITLRNRQGTKSPAVIKSVLHVPELSANLLSVKVLTEGGTDVVFRKSIGAILVANRGTGPEIGFARESGQLYKLDARVVPAQATAFTAYIEPGPENEQEAQEAPKLAAYTDSQVSSSAGAPVNMGDMVPKYERGQELSKSPKRPSETIGAARQPSASIEHKSSAEPVTPPAVPDIDDATPSPELPKLPKNERFSEPKTETTSLEPDALILRLPEPESTPPERYTTPVGDQFDPSTAETSPQAIIIAPTDPQTHDAFQRASGRFESRDVAPPDSGKIPQCEDIGGNGKELPEKVGDVVSVPKGNQSSIKQEVKPSEPESTPKAMFGAIARLEMVTKLLGRIKSPDFVVNLGMF